MTRLLQFSAATVVVVNPFVAEAPTAFKRAIGRQAVRVRNGGRRLFSAAGQTATALIAGHRLCIAKNKIAAARRPRLRCGRSRCARRCRPVPPAVS
jgi:hypothetical protein